MLLKNLYIKYYNKISTKNLNFIIITLYCTLLENTSTSLVKDAFNYGS